MHYYSNCWANLKIALHGGMDFTEKQESISASTRWLFCCKTFLEQNTTIPRTVFPVYIDPLLCAMNEKWNKNEKISWTYTIFSQISSELETQVKTIYSSWGFWKSSTCSKGQATHVINDTQAVTSRRLLLIILYTNTTHEAGIHYARQCRRTNFPSNKQLPSWGF